MIRYALKCTDGHAFESWFQSGEAFDALAAKGLVTCAVCGSDDVAKALMTPKVDGGRAAVAEAPGKDLESRLTALRKKIESEATWVGGRFAEEARKLHDAQVTKPIYGEANAEQIGSLLEAGVPIAPLPFRPKAKVN